MATITVASKASQAVTLPVLLVASFANESDQNTSITISFEEADGLGSSDAPVELCIGDNAPVHTQEQTINTLVESYPFLGERHGKDVWRNSDDGDVDRS